MHLSLSRRRLLLGVGLTVAAAVVHLLACLVGLFLVWWFVAGEAIHADVVAPGVLGAP